jgi:hypothetical protein
MTVVLGGHLLLAPTSIAAPAVAHQEASLK